MTKPGRGRTKKEKAQGPGQAVFRVDRVIWGG